MMRRRIRIEATCPYGRPGQVVEAESTRRLERLIDIGVVTDVGYEYGQPEQPVPEQEDDDAARAEMADDEA